MQFSKKSSRKRKRCSDDRLYKKIAKLEKKKQKLKYECDLLRKKNVRNSTRRENSSTTPKNKTVKKMSAAGIHSEDTPDIKKQFLFTERISKKNEKAGREKKNRKGNTRTMLNGKILKKYSLFQYART